MWNLFLEIYWLCYTTPFIMANTQFRLVWSRGSDQLSDIMNIWTPALLFEERGQTATYVAL